MDSYIFYQINELVFKYHWLDALGIFFAQYFGYVLTILLLLFLVKSFKKYWKMVLQALLAGILARFIIVEIIRYFIPKSRPFVENSINTLMSHLPEPSFPSGHAAFFFAISTIVYSCNKKAGIVFFIASIFIGIARIFTGVHWPSDILVGAAVGIISALLILLSFRKFSLAVKSQLPQQQ
ncbi:phosphatase PAP2 family protein [Patescibacteria group bacterium]